MTLWIQSASTTSAAPPPAAVPQAPPEAPGSTPVPLKRNENGGVGLNFSKEGQGPFNIVAVTAGVRTLSVEALVHVAFVKS